VESIKLIDRGHVINWDKIEKFWEY